MYNFNNFYFDITVTRTSAGIFATDNKRGVKVKLAAYKSGPLESIVPELLRMVAIVSDKGFGELSEKGKIVKRESVDFIDYFNLENYSCACLFREAVKVNLALAA